MHTADAQTAQWWQRDARYLYAIASGRRMERGARPRHPVRHAAPGCPNHYERT
jgi:hypothetical protein